MSPQVTQIINQIHELDSDQICELFSALNFYYPSSLLLTSEQMMEISARIKGYQSGFVNPHQLAEIHID